LTGPLYVHHLETGNPVRALHSVDPVHGDPVHGGEREGCRPTSLSFKRSRSGRCLPRRGPTHSTGFTRPAHRRFPMTVARLRRHLWSDQVVTLLDNNAMTKAPSPLLRRLVNLSRYAPQPASIPHQGRPCDRRPRTDKRPTRRKVGRLQHGEFPVPLRCGCANNDSRPAGARTGSGMPTPGPGWGGRAGILHASPPPS